MIYLRNNISKTKYDALDKFFKLKDKVKYIFFIKIILKKS